jgi:hypothetical protein
MITIVKDFLQKKLFHYLIPLQKDCGISNLMGTASKNVYTAKDQGPLLKM